MVNYVSGHVLARDWHPIVQDWHRLDRIGMDWPRLAWIGKNWGCSIVLNSSSEKTRDHPT